VIDRDYLIDVLNERIEADRSLSRSIPVLDILFDLHVLKKENLIAFEILVKMKSPRIFDFLS
jgi:hypothetical protein